MTAVEACKSCGAPMRFVKWKTSGRWVPLNVEPKADGNVVIERERGMDRAVCFNDQDPAHLSMQRYVSHFVTCPKAAAHRSRA